MDLSTIWYTVSDLFSTLSPTRKELKLHQFNNYLQMADTDLLLIHLGMKDNPGVAVEKDNEQIDVLERFKTAITFSSVTSIPPAYVRHVDGGAWLNDGTPVDYVSVREHNDRQSNAWTVGSADHPYVYSTNGTLISVPSTVGNINFYYFKANTGNDKPELVFKEENGIPVYDSSASEELLWREYMYPSIIMLILKYLGISINDPNVIQEKLKEYAPS